MSEFARIVDTWSPPVVHSEERVTAGPTCAPSSPPELDPPRDDPAVGDNPCRTRGLPSRPRRASIPTRTTPTEEGTHGLGRT